jgi:hypothetical protein
VLLAAVQSVLNHGKWVMVKHHWTWIYLFGVFGMRVERGGIIYTFIIPHYIEFCSKLM